MRLNPTFEDRLRQAIAQAERTGEAFALHVLGADGTPQGLAERVGTLVRRSDSWTELGPGRLAILQRAVNEPEGALLLARKLATVLDEGQPRRADGRPRITVGLCFHSPGSSLEELLERARRARREAVADGERIRCWDGPGTPSPILLHQQLAGALVRGELFLEFQPQVEIGKGSLTAFEALVRWRHPVHGVLAPDLFVPLAEKSGLIVELGSWVLEEALHRCREWNRTGFSGTSVAVNVSAIELLDPGHPDSVARALERAGLGPELLEIELTETAAVQSLEKTEAALLQLKKGGLRLALDDFGTGYNSLRALHQLPIDKVKIPKEFVQDGANPGTPPMIESIAVIGRRLGLEVVAEGVETLEQLTTARSAGCHTAQGYFVGRPQAVFPGSPAATGWLGIRPPIAYDPV